MNNIYGHNDTNITWYNEQYLVIVILILQMKLIKISDLKIILQIKYGIFNYDYWKEYKYYHLWEMLK